MGLGSEIPDPGPGFKKAPDPGFGSATLVYLNEKTASRFLKHFFD
jgi:hypothetical protein